MSVPLISEYKRTFIIRRLITTFLGGLDIGDLKKLSGRQATLDLFAFSWPAFVGAAATVLGELELLRTTAVDSSMASLIAFSLVIQVPLLIRQVSHNGKCSPSPVVRPQRTTFLFLLCLTSSVVLMTLAMTHIRLQTIRTLFTSESLVYTTVILEWLAVCIANASLFIKSPVETATYKATENLALLILNRPAHLIIIFSLHLVAHKCIFDEDEQLRSIASQTATALVSMSPFLWLFGLWPPLSALFPWTLERINVLILGGSASPSIRRLSVSIVASLALSTTCLVTRGLTYFTLVASMAGFALSFDLYYFLKTSLAKKNWISLATRFLIFAAQTTIILALIMLFRQRSDINNHDSLATFLFSSLVVVFALNLLCEQLQQIHLMRLLRNPLYPVRSPSVDSSRGVDKLKRFQEKMAKLSRLLQRTLMPLVATAHVSITILIEERNEKKPSNGEDKVTFFYELLLFVATLRVYRRLWTSTVHCTLAIIVSNACIRNGWWGIEMVQQNLRVLYVWWAVDTVIDIIFQSLNKFFMVLVLTGCSVVLRNQRLPVNWLLVALNLLVSPLILIMIITSSTMSMPIMPLFSLPLFLPGFPRPTKFWAQLGGRAKKEKRRLGDAVSKADHGTNDGEGRVFYQHLLPRLVRELNQQSRVLGHCEAGSYLLARFQDRLIWLEVLESGFCQVNFRVKGLELQETSCHSIEASRVDDVLERSFYSRALLNRYCLHAFQPAAVVQVRTYSDARNVLTGVIDSPDTRNSVKQLFSNVFLWTLIHFRATAELPAQKRPKTSSSATKEQDRAFSSAANFTNESVGQTPIVPLATYAFDGSSATVLEKDTEHYSRGHFEGNFEPLPAWLSVAKKLGTPRNSDAHYQSLSEEWLRLVLHSHALSPEQINFSNLYFTYRQLISSCYMTLFVPSNGSVFRDIDFDANSLYEIFYGSRPPKEMFAECSNLRDLLIKSFRYTLKISFDQILWGNSGEGLSNGDLVTILEDFDRNWYFSNEENSAWSEKILEDKPHIFSIGRDLVANKYTSRLLTLQDMDVFVFHLNRAVVEGLWCTLSLELLYLTNDDEERYSIQAHPTILRNITVQAADAPLGYPLFVSPTIKLCDF